MDIYQEMLEAGVEIANHLSDLYVPVTERTKAIVNRYEYKSNVTTFRCQISGNLWYDIPFAYKLYWKERLADKYIL